MSEISVERQMWTLVRGAMATKALGLVADLGIADKLAAGPRHVADLAGETRSDEDSLYRFLRALASDGVFAEQDHCVFANTPLSELLIADRSDSWRDFAHLFGGVWYETFADASGALANGEPTFANRFGADFWAWLAQNPSEGASFNRAMASGTDQQIDWLTDREWRDGETVVDVGGGNGATLVALLRRHPRLNGIVFDLPETARDAERVVGESDVADRCRVVAGSFFDSAPTGDTYVLAGIIHDWDDDHASQILRTVREAAPANARVLIRDAVIAPGNDAHGSKWLDLLMLVLLRGRERSEGEWRALLSNAGFEASSISDGLVQARCRPTRPSLRKDQQRR